MPHRRGTIKWTSVLSETCWENQHMSTNLYTILSLGRPE